MKHAMNNITPTYAFVACVSRVLVAQLVDEQSLVAVLDIEARK